MNKRGNLYGTTFLGGKFGYGSAFRLNAKGGEKVLHSFSNGTDGARPLAGLVMDKKGNVYGTTIQGGTHNAGTVFQLNATGAAKILHSFDNTGTDGFYPYGGLVMDTKGNLYGTTTAGGTYNGGTVFELGPNGTETILHNFGNGVDGNAPAVGLVIDAEGNLYGTTNYGGANSSCNGGRGCGTAFELSTNGTETILYNFGASGTDGYYPYAGLVMDTKGNLYGTTALGGANSSCNAGSGCGTAFKLTANGTETILHSFGATETDGYSPFDALAIDTNGNLYGTTANGGQYGSGIIFKLTP